MKSRATFAVGEKDKFLAKFVNEASFGNYKVGLGLESKWKVVAGNQLVF